MIRHPQVVKDVPLDFGLGAGKTGEGGTTFIGRPQWGQAGAWSEILSAQSGHVVRGIYIIPGKGATSMCGS